LTTLSLGLAVCVLAGGCSSSDSKATESVSPHDSFPVGGRASFALLSHCGVQFDTIDGSTWRTKPHNDGNGNAPHGWPSLSIRGVLTRPSQTRVVFVSDDIPVRLVFRPAPGVHWSCM
jgi:hypothetical protein